MGRRGESVRPAVIVTATIVTATIVTVTIVKLNRSRDLVKEYVRSAIPPPSLAGLPDFSW
jgi:mRNA-degrading endonuclease toxin of MazEF toxin-antitoxin module